jgi:amyloid beta precursor protein binding protein 1
LGVVSLWAATGQNALEASRILVLSASATSTSILKNLVLPGIGHFTILDASAVTPQDAGNNFFLEGPDSIGKNRAEEAVRLLGELNDGVGGEAVKESVEDVLRKKPEWVKGFSLVVSHNLEKRLLEKLSALLWEDEAGPPLVMVKSAGFLAEFFIQFHDHASGLVLTFVPSTMYLTKSTFRRSNRISFRISAFSTHNQPLSITPLPLHLSRLLQDGSY